MNLSLLRRFILAILPALFGGLAPKALAAADSETPPPGTASPSGELSSRIQIRLAETFGAQLDAEIPGLLATTGEPGVAVVLVEDGSTAWIKTWGVADRASKRPVTPETAFQIGSLSKTLTAWGVARLADGGQIDLDAPVSKYLKRWQIPASEFDAGGVTIRRLLSHTAGVSLASLSGVDLGKPVPSVLEELRGRGRSQPGVALIAAPGSGYRYSGGGYAILQLMIEDVTGQPFAEYMRVNVLAPLGMSHASFEWNPDLAQRVATPYGEQGEAHPHRLFSGVAGAGLYVTARDFAAFLEAHCATAAAKPGRGVISPARLDELVTADSASPSYALGYRVDPSPFPGVTAAAHGGSNRGWTAEFMILPKAGLGCFVATNTNGRKTRTHVMRAFRSAVDAAARE